jgi:hypothetical protein
MMEGAGVQVATVDLLSLAGLVAGVVSILLAFWAMYMSYDMFARSKDTETSVSNALAGIRAQTETLSALSGQQMQSLTSMVRDQLHLQSRADPRFDALYDLTKLAFSNSAGFVAGQSPGNTSGGASIDNPGLPNLPPNVDQETLKAWNALYLMAIYFYTVHVNILLQGQLPAPADYDEANEQHRFVRQLLDISAADFKSVATHLDNWATADRAYLDSRENLVGYVEMAKRLKSSVKNSNQIMHPDGASSGGS